MNRILAISTAALFSVSVLAFPVAAQTPGTGTPGATGAAPGATPGAEAPTGSQSPGAAQAPGAAAPGAGTPGGDRTTITGPDATGATGFNVHGFWTDDTRTQLLGEQDFRAHFQTLTPEEQANLRAECERHAAGTATADAEWLALCERVGGI
jgi:hypothetical protein